MIAPSTRHVPWLLLALVAVLVPVARSGFEVQRNDHCADPAALLALDGVPGTQTFSERYEKYDEDVPQWTQVELERRQRGVELSAAVVRSFDPIDLYTRPPRIVLGKFEAGQRDLERVAVDDHELVIQTIFERGNGRESLASWVFVFDGRPVRHPILAQLRTAGSQVWTGTRPLTLLVAGGRVPSARRDEARAQARDWLVAAYRHHRAACAPEAVAR